MHLSHLLRIRLACFIWVLGFVSPFGWLPAFAQDEEEIQGTYLCATYLKSIHDPPQKFQIQSDITHRLKLAHGTELLVPKNCFGLDRGESFWDASLVKGLIDLEITEVVDPMAFLMYNIPVVWSEDGASKPIAVHGAIRIKARWEGRKLRMRSSKSVLVLFANHPARGAINLHGSHSKSEFMVWEREYYPRGDDYAGELTEDGAKLDDQYRYVGNIGKASPVTHTFAAGNQSVEDVIIGKTLDPESPIDWSKVQLWVDGKGYPKQLSGIHGGLASPIAAVQVLAAIQWDVAKWDTLKPISFELPPSQDFAPIGSGVPEEYIIFSNTVRAIERFEHLEEMLALMPEAKVKEFLDHALCVSRMGWSATGHVVDAKRAKEITVDLGLQYNDAKVFLTIPQDTIVLEGLQQPNGMFQFPAVPDGRTAKIIAMAYSTNLGPLLGVELIETVGGTRRIAMKSLPWSILEAMIARAHSQK